MSFGNLLFTSKGRALQAKAETGIQLNFTRIAIGDGQLSGQDISELNDLIHKVKDIEITKLEVLENGKAAISGVLSNQDLQTGFYWRELGLFAQDPQLGEILYCYGNAGALAEYIPAGGGAEILEKKITIHAIINDASNVTATINNSLVYATLNDLSILQEEIDNLSKITISSNAPSQTRSTDLWFKIL
jgi:phage-related tail fiber protein